MNKKPMKFKVKWSLLDLLAFKNLTKNRSRRFSKAGAEKPETPFINELASRLHPARQHLVIKEVKEETGTTRTYTFEPDKDSGTTEPAFFQAGQYLSVKADVNGYRITRPYSIASSPSDALKGLYELTIKKTPGGFFTDYIWNNWKAGVKVITSAPMGLMVYNPIRDSKNITALAGGSGITPFRSMAREICYGGMDAKLKIIYGCSDESDIMYHQEFKELASRFPDKFSFVLVMSCEEISIEGCEKGFITRDIIKKHSDPSNDTYFLCGPDLMYDFVGNELRQLAVPLRRIRHEAYGEIKNPARFESYPKAAAGRTYTLQVHTTDGIKTVSASGKESVLVALERARLAPPSACRSGECQFCRTLLIRGDIWVSPESDGRREGDKKTGYFHPCASFPVSDLEIELPNPDSQ